MADAVVITDADHRIIYWNVGAESLYGFTAGEAIGRRMRDLAMPPRPDDRGPQVMARVSAGDSFSGEWTMQHKDGRQFPVFVSTSAVFDESGTPTQFIGISRDASRQKAAFRTTQLLASIAENSTDAIVSCDVTGTVTWVNEQLTGVFGWSPEELIGQHISVMAPDGDRAKQDAAMERVRAGGDPPPMVTRRKRRDGGLVDVSISIGKIRDEDGHICGTSAVLRDLTVENELRRDLERQAEKFRARFEQTATPQTLMDLTGNFIAVNDAFCTLLGRSRQELLRMSRTSVTHISDSGEGDRQVALIRSGRQQSASFERRLRHRDGHPIQVLIDITMLYDDSGNPLALASFVRDLSPVATSDELLSRHRAVFRALTQRASDVGCVADAELILRFVSPAVTENFGYPADDLVGQSCWNFVHSDDMPMLRHEVKGVLRDPDGFQRGVIRVRAASGEWRWVETSMTNALHDEAIRGVVLNLRDVTLEVQAEDKLRRSEARYRAIAEAAQEGIAVFTHSGETAFVNQKLADLLGHPLAELAAINQMGLFDPETEQLLRQKLLHRTEVGPERYEVPYLHPDGTWHILSFSVTPLPLPDTDEVGALAMVADVTEARRAESQLRHRAAHDVLTDLPNRTLLSERIRAALAGGPPTARRSTALLFLDLDHFKLVNDSRGHDAGDTLLKEIGSRLRHVIRPQDTVARIGGDEFAVLCEDVDEELALAIAGRLRDALSAPVEIGGPRVYVDASIGIALSPPHDADALLRFADVAMYEAKASGRGRIRVFDASLAVIGERRLVVMNALREALDKDSLSLHYQPVVDVATGRLVGVEALLRWTDDDLGPVSPVEVVAAADAMGLSSALDRWVVERACAEMAAMRHQCPPGLDLAVNVSARSFAASGLDDIFVAATAESGWPASNLILEVTESAIMTDAPSAVTLLHRLKARGARIAIDDFGTGYSSLAYLKRLPVSIVKIDRSFIDQVTTDADSGAIVTSIIQMSSALGLVVVAEGIETADQAEMMRNLGCSVGQGHYWSPAVPAADLARVVCELDLRRQANSR